MYWLFLLVIFAVYWLFVLLIATVYWLTSDCSVCWLFMLVIVTVHWLLVIVIVNVYRLASDCCNVLTVPAGDCCRLLAVCASDCYCVLTARSITWNTRIPIVTRFCSLFLTYKYLLSANISSGEPDGSRGLDPSLWSWPSWRCLGQLSARPSTEWMFKVNEY